MYLFFYLAKVDSVVPRLKVISKLLELIFNQNSEIQEENFLHYFNFVIKNFSHNWRENSFFNNVNTSSIVNKFSPRNKQISNSKEYDDYTKSMIIVESHFPFCEIAIYQKLRKETETNHLAQEFKQKCSTKNQKLISDLENMKITNFHFSPNCSEIIQTMRELIKCDEYSENYEKTVENFLAIIKELLSTNSCDVFKYAIFSLISSDSHFINKIKTLISCLQKLCERENLGEFQLIVWLKEFVSKNNVEVHENTSSDSMDMGIDKIKFILFCWGVPENVIELLVPAQICDFASFMKIDFTSCLKELNCSIPIGKRRQWQREKLSFFDTALGESIRSMRIPFAALTVEQMGIWLILVNLDQYAPLFANLNISGADFLLQSSDSLKAMGICIGHRKLLLRYIDTYNKLYNK